MSMLTVDVAPKAPRRKNRRDERSVTLTNRSSELNQIDPASGTGTSVPVDEARLGPYSDVYPVDSDIHLGQNFILRESIDSAWEDRTDYFAGVNLTVYYKVAVIEGSKVREKMQFRGPDFFVAIGVENIVGRRSWVVSNEGKFPDVIVEVLSRGTKRIDRGKKKEIYEQIFKTHEYFMSDPHKETLEGFRLVNGAYVPIVPDERGHLWSEKLEMFFGLAYHERFKKKMTRLFQRDGSMVLTGREQAHEANALVKREHEQHVKARAEAEKAQALAEYAQADAGKARADAGKARADAEKARADAEKARTDAEKARVLAEREHEERERLEAMLRQLGVDPGKRQ